MGKRVFAEYEFGAGQEENSYFLLRGSTISEPKLWVGKVLRLFSAEIGRDGNAIEITFSNNFKVLLPWIPWTSNWDIFCWEIVEKY